MKRSIITIIALFLLLQSPMVSADYTSKVCGPVANITSIAYDMGQSGMTFKQFVGDFNVPNGLKYEVAIAFDAVWSGKTREEMLEEAFEFCTATR